jgi:hypothetical protein
MAKNTNLWDTNPGNGFSFLHSGLITTRFLFSALQEPFRENFFSLPALEQGCQPVPRCYIEISGLPTPMVL